MRHSSIYPVEIPAANGDDELALVKDAGYFLQHFCHILWLHGQDHDIRIPDSLLIVFGYTDAVCLSELFQLLLHHIGYGDLARSYQIAGQDAFDKGAAHFASPDKADLFSF